MLDPRRSLNTSRQESRTGFPPLDAGCSLNRWACIHVTNSGNSRLASSPSQACNLDAVRHGSTCCSCHDHQHAKRLRHAVSRFIQTTAAKVWMTRDRFITCPVSSKLLRRRRHCVIRTSAHSRHVRHSCTYIHAYIYIYIYVEKDL